MSLPCVRWVAAGAAALLLTAYAGRGRAADATPEPEDLRRGLVAVFHDAAKPPAEVVRLEPTVALALGAGEAAHPKLQPDGGTVVWKGYLNVLRGGVYHFEANLRGAFRLTVDGKEVLAGDVRDDKPAHQVGAELRLNSGVLPLVAEYTRPAAGSARVEVYWQGPGFRLEPLPFDHLGHLPNEAPTALAAGAKVEQGRFLAEEHGCVKCHAPAASDGMAKTLATRQAPDLSKVGGRVHARWIEAWLEAPAKLRPGTTMPSLLADDDNGKAERYAVAHYLASLGGPLTANAKPPSKKDMTDSVNRGQKLFMTIGCVACHGPEKDKIGGEKKDNGPAFIAAAAAHFPLTGLAAKTTPEKLAEYLQNPTATDPGGRMPHMLLQGREATDLAHYLCQPDKDDVKGDLSAPPAAYAKASAAEIDEAGKRLVVAKGCVNCHTIAPGGKPLAPSLTTTALEDLGKKKDAGCLADAAAKRGKAPAFAFSDADRDALRAWLDDGLQGVGSPAPAFAARETIRQMNCIACHTKDGEGGLSTEVVEQLRKFENAENAEAVAPPTLTGVGHKLRTPWLRQVLLSAGRARPWMGLRMPQFGEPNIGRLPDALAALEGTAPDDDTHKTPLTAAKIEAGRTLIGKNAFGCVSCHDLAGVANSGTRGPDLAGMNQRVRYEWYLRWLEQPQRMQPGTRMPQVFTDGKSLLATVLNGDAVAQADAIWGYLSLGPGLPLPEGVGAPKGLVLTVKDRPFLLRTFMPDAGSRAVAVGFPVGVSAAFDAHTCRLAYAWSGPFLDASPVWNDRGGNPAHVLGPHVWNAPAGCPVGATSSDEPPDFAARAKDPAFGAPLPEGRLFQGVRLVHFDGYAEDKDGVPTFRYHLQAGTDDRLDAAERIEALRNGTAAGVARRFTLNVPARQTAWLLAGESAGEPHLLDAKGAAVPLDLKGGSAEAAAAGGVLALPQEGDRVIVLKLAAAPPGAVWRVRKGGAGWQALVRVPAAAEASKPAVDLDVWAPYRNDPELIKELLSAR